MSTQCGVGISVLQTSTGADGFSIFIDVYTFVVLSVIAASVLLPPSRANVAICTTMAILCECFGFGHLLLFGVAQGVAGGAHVQATYFVCALMSLILAVLWGIRAADRRARQKSRDD